MQNQILANHDIKETHAFMAKSGGRSSLCCGLALSHGLLLHIGLSSLRLPTPLEQNIPRKVAMSMSVYHLNSFKLDYE